MLKTYIYKCGAHPRVDTGNPAFINIADHTDVFGALEEYLGELSVFGDRYTGFIPSFINKNFSRYRLFRLFILRAPPIIVRIFLSILCKSHSLFNSP